MSLPPQGVNDLKQHLTDV